MATLVEAAQRFMDLYYQNYAPNDKFLDIDDFKFQTAISYSSMLNKLYQTERRANKQTEGWSNIEIPAAWLIEEQIDIKYDKVYDRYYAELKHPVFSFDFDNAANGLQGVHSIGPVHCLYRKISLNERRFRQVIPVISANLFYLNSPTILVFWGPKEDKIALTQYVPRVVGEQNDCILSDNIIADLQIQVLDTMFKAKNGNFIQKLDDQNPNVVPQQQVNPVV